MRICCVSIDNVTNEVKEAEFNCSQTSKDTIKNIIEKKLIEFLGEGQDPYVTKSTAYHVCVMGNGKTGFGSPIKGTTKLTDTLRVYDKDWSEVDSYLVSLNPPERTALEILKAMRAKFGEFTLTNVYYRLRANGLTYKKSRRGKRSNDFSLE